MVKSAFSSARWDPMFSPNDVTIMRVICQMRSKTSMGVADRWSKGPSTKSHFDNDLSLSGK
jgi:hypothetical protein